MVIYAGVKGYLDKIEVSKIREFEATILRELQGGKKSIADAITKEEKLTDAIEAEMKTLITDVISRIQG